MSKRSDAEKRLATTMLSPFNERAVNVVAKLTTLEKDMYEWLISYVEGGELVVFHWTFFIFVHILFFKL